MIIDINKKYRTSDGRNVRILCTNRKALNERSVIGLIDMGIYELDMIWDIHGKQGDSPFCDLVEITPYSDWEVDKPVIVWDNPEKRIVGHFARVSAERFPMIWENGKTSFTTNVAFVYRHAIPFQE